MAIDAAAGLAGGCQCGAVRYRLMAEPTGANICHCRMCQKASGGPFTAFGDVRLSEFVITSGAIATFSSSDIAKRGFCARCGTPLTYEGLGSDHISVTLGSLDNPGRAPNAAWSLINGQLAYPFTKPARDSHRAMANEEEDRGRP